MLLLQFGDCLRVGVAYVYSRAVLLKSRCYAQADTARRTGHQHARTRPYFSDGSHIHNEPFIAATWPGIEKASSISDCGSQIIDREEFMPHRSIRIGGEGRLREAFRSAGLMAKFFLKLSDPSEISSKPSQLVRSGERPDAVSQFDERLGRPPGGRNHQSNHSIGHHDDVVSTHAAHVRH